MMARPTSLSVSTLWLVFYLLSDSPKLKVGGLGTQRWGCRQFSGGGKKSQNSSKIHCMGFIGLPRGTGFSNETILNLNSTVFINQARFTGFLPACYLQ